MYNKKLNDEIRKEKKIIDKIVKEYWDTYNTIDMSILADIVQKEIGCNRSETFSKIDRSISRVFKEKG